MSSLRLLSRLLPRLLPRFAAALAVAVSLPCCSYGVSDGADVKVPGREVLEPGADGSRCEFAGRTDREVAESVSTGALQPSIRRVYRVVGEGNQRRRVLVCREVDSNRDGIKDVVRRYSEQGQALEELADTNYDGRIDTTIRFAKGRVAQEIIDLDQDDKPEETRYYQAGKLSRVQRDTNRDGKPDVWEIYAGGRLERMGQDVDFDGRVDRWNRDEVNERAAREAEEKASEPNAAGQ